MDRRTRDILLVMLGISLFLNWQCWWKLSAQTRQLDELRSQLRNTASAVQNVESSIGGLRQTLEESARWVATTEFVPQPDASTREQLVVACQWALREVGARSRVFLLYREAGAASWVKLPAVRQGATYSARMQLVPGKTYQYQIAEEGDLLRTSELLEVPGEYYQYDGFYFQGIAGGQLGPVWRNVSLDFYQGPVYYDFYRITDLQAKVFDGDTLLATLPVQREDLGKEIQWHLEIDGLKVGAIRLVATFGDGSTREAAVWPEPEKHAGESLFDVR